MIGGGYTHSPPPEGTGVGAAGAFHSAARPASPRRGDAVSRPAPFAAAGGCAAASAPRRGRRLLAERLSVCAAPGRPAPAQPRARSSRRRRAPPAASRPARLTAAAAPSPRRPLAAAGRREEGAAAPPC